MLRFMIQDLIGNAVPAFKETTSWTNNLIGSALSCALWGYFLYVGVIDPLGGIWTLWPLFGTANQMLAAIALTVCTVVLFKMKRERFAWVTIVPRHVARGLHDHCRAREGAQPRSKRGVHQPRTQVRRRHRSG